MEDGQNQISSLHSFSNVQVFVTPWVPTFWYYFLESSLSLAGSWKQDTKCWCLVPPEQMVFWLEAGGEREPCLPGCTSLENFCLTELEGKGMVWVFVNKELLKFLLSFSKFSWTSVLICFTDSSSLPGNVNLAVLSNLSFLPILLGSRFMELLSPYHEKRKSES